MSIRLYVRCVADHAGKPVPEDDQDLFDETVPGHVVPRVHDVVEFAKRPGRYSVASVEWLIGFRNKSGWDAEVYVKVERLE